ncbi:hypothetical protein GF366_00995, partial [Candidatus Peregrinibacteria bacterium]|nr:hypothetical protein [Candidatus Peregrinibacteria bacterium]
MKKISAKLLLIPLLLLNFTQTSHAEFKDVFHLHKNYDAIIYLQENDMIQGYPDNTFKPENKINRAEFLKIIMEGTDIPLDIQQNAPFSDINQNSWYAPYVKKAYKEGWISGYPDKTFKPEQTINKVEALKILGELQNWDIHYSITTAPYNDTPVSEWYTKYVAYAKNHNYLEEAGSTFSPENPMTRAKICEIIYRTL